nr:unnamed protein product [Spirometra erinaceieuropaei]
MFKTAAEAFEVNKGEYLIDDFEQRDISVIATELPVPLRLVETAVDRVLQVLEDLFSMSHLQEDDLKFVNQPEAAVLVNIGGERVVSRRFLADKFM